MLLWGATENECWCTDWAVLKGLQNRLLLFSQPQMQTKREALSSWRHPCTPEVKEVPGVTLYLLLILDKAIDLGEALLISDRGCAVEPEMPLTHHHVLVIVKALVRFVHSCLATAVGSSIVCTDRGC
jgi:hypothetical protein